MSIKGRGADSNPHNRFARRISIIDAAEPLTAAPITEVRCETVRSLISYNDSPDIAFDRSINPYRVITP